MKCKTTNKYVKDYASHILRAGYCKMQNLLKYQNPIAYTYGICGWNYDVYEINGVTICTGYRNMPENYRVNVNIQTIADYEKMAKNINNNYNLKFEEREEQVNKLLYEFLEKIKIGE